MTRAALAVAVLLASSPMAAAQPGATLPDSPGVEVARARCLGCHQSDLIEGQRLSEAAWAREVGKMERWGAMLTDGERAALIGYLARHFGPRLMRAGRDQADHLARGEAAMQRSCRPCHGTDLIEQQRLARAAWAREVDKMIRWGATVEDTEKDALVDFLATRWGPRRR